MASNFLLLGLFMIISCSIVFATQRYQDFCVADLNSQVKINGIACKDPQLVNVNDFHFSGLDIPANTSNRIGAGIIPVLVPQLPGLNTLDISMFRADFAPGGAFPPHFHPRATELLTVIEGRLLVGFNSSTNQVFNKKLRKGDVFVVPQGLIHFAKNIGRGKAMVIVAFSSQNPGVINIITS